jgi:hypothetical protein
MTEQEATLTRVWLFAGEAIEVLPFEDGATLAWCRLTSDESASISGLQRHMLERMANDLLAVAARMDNLVD